ncbi:MAG: hypothetical protein GXP30_13735 [Verrucomicrobia bacterium]|nr:hypothetical protein [Verrucomicrobiota bacterium]
MAAATQTKDSWKPVLEQAKLITGFSTEDEQLIRKATSSLAPCAQEIAAEFYEKLLDYEPTAAILKDLDPQGQLPDEHLARWVTSLIKGQYDDEFWTWHWVIGLILVQYNLDHVNLTSLLGQLQKILIKQAFATFRESSAIQITYAFLNLTNCLSIVTLKSYLLEYNSAIEASGLKQSVLNRMISMEVKNKITIFSKASA